MRGGGWTREEEMRREKKIMRSGEEKERGDENQTL
jgi:hypothetical protein